MINTIAVRVEPGASIEAVAAEIRHWKHVEVYTSPRQVKIRLISANRLIVMQFSLLRLLLLIIAGVIIGPIIYTFTLDKSRYRRSETARHTNVAHLQHDYSSRPR